MIDFEILVPGYLEVGVPAQILEALLRYLPSNSLITFLSTKKQA